MKQLCVMACKRTCRHARITETAGTTAHDILFPADHKRKAAYGYHIRYRETGKRLPNTGFQSPEQQARGQPGEPKKNTGDH